MERRENLSGRRKARGQESVGSVGAGRGYLENSNEAESEAQGAQGLNKNCRESMSPLSCLIRGFHNK